MSDSEGQSPYRCRPTQCPHVGTVINFMGKRPDGGLVISRGKVGLFGGRKGWSKLGSGIEIQDLKKQK